MALFIKYYRNALCFSYQFAHPSKQCQEYWIIKQRRCLRSYNLIYKISYMLQKTEMSEASTNAEHKTTSFYTSKNREMFRELKKSESPPKNKTSPRISNQRLPNDLISFEPEIINNLSWPEIYLFENDLKACVKDNFYEISGMRGRNKFLPRNSEASSELIYFWGERPTKKINLFSIQRYMVREKEEEQLYNHINLSKFDPDTNAFDSSDFYLICEKRQGKGANDHEIWDFRSFQTIQNCRKGVMIMKIINKNSEGSNGLYKILLIDLIDKKKQLGESQKTLAKILTTIDLDCDLNFGQENQKFLKSIKSEFGDIILIITSKEIYELEIEDMGEGYKLSLKPYKISKTITGTKDNYLKSEGNIKTQTQIKQKAKDMNARTEEIQDVQFMSNGLKIMILTNYDQIIFIEAHNFLFSQNIHDILAAAQIHDKYKLDSLNFTNLYSINGSIALEFNSKNDANILQEQEQFQSPNSAQKVTKGFILLKAQNNYLAFGKIINLPFHTKDVEYRAIHECQGFDEILIQFIEKKNPYSLNVIKCRTLMTELNSIVKLETIEYNYPRVIDFSQNILSHLHSLEQQKKYSHCELPTASRIFYFLNEKELTCYKIFNELDAQKISKPMAKLLNHTFFQKPIKIAVSPLTLHFAIIFKEFVKFFYFNYYSIKNYFTLKVKNILDVEYVDRGSKVMISTLEGFVYLLDAYSFEEKKIFQFYGEPSKVELIDEKHLLVKSNKQILNFYKRGWDDDENARQFQKQYEIKLEEGDHYVATLENILVFKKGAQIEVYSHVPLEIASDLPQAERQCYANLQASHKHLVNRRKCNSFSEGEIATKILLNQELGFLFVSTNKGNIKQYLWPMQSPTNPNPPQVFTQQVSSAKIISINLDAKYTYLYAVSEYGTISQLQMHQYIGGELMPYVYIFSEKTRHDEQQKREFTDRNYFIDNFAPTEFALVQASQQNVQELQFFMDKLKDDLQQMTKNLLFSGKQKEIQLKKYAKTDEEQFKAKLKVQERNYCLELQQIRKKLELNEKQAEIQKNKEIEQYQRTLLELYKESDRLKKILKVQDQKLSEQKTTFKKQFAIVLQKYNTQKDEELVKLQNEYKSIEQRRVLSHKQNEILDKQEEIEMKLYKVKIHEQEQNELRGEDEYKEKLLGENTKKQKAISNLRNRENYFQNLILETKVQIAELKKDQVEYENKKQYLKQELKDKEEIIEKIEKELVLYLRNTEDMKTIKNNHEFELNEYEKEVNPIQDDYKRIEENVKHMNVEIMKEYNHKVQKIDDIKVKFELIASLKDRKKKLTIKKLEEQGKFKRLTEKLTDLAKHTFDVDIKQQLKEVLDSNEKDNLFVKQDEQKEKQKKDGEKLLRYKNMIRKQIQEQEKREEHIIKNQHEFYKYHIENTTLVREFNDLKKTQKILSDQYYKLMEKLDMVKASRANTPLRRVPSINLRKAQEKKLTPYQRYEEEQTSINVRKNQDTSDTKLSRNSQSLSFLKGLMKEVNQTDSKFEKLEVMRERVRTFVNPELRKPEEIKKILFGRTRGTSEMLKLK